MFGLRALCQRQEIVRLVAVILRLYVLVPIVLGDDHVGALTINHRVEGMLALLDVVDGLGLGDPPASGRPRVGATDELDTFMWIMTVCLVDTIDLQIHLSIPFREEGCLEANALSYGPRRSCFERLTQVTDVPPLLE